MSGESTKVGGTEINLPAVSGAPDELLKSMFAPVAEAIGERLATDYRRMHAETLSEGESDNLRKHAETVRARGDSPTTEPTRKQRSNLFEWIEDASEANPDSAPEEAAKWQAVLNEILGRNDKTSLDTLRSLNAYDVKAIHSLSCWGGTLPKGQAEKLISLGVIERKSSFNSPIFIPCTLMGVFSFLPVLNNGLIDVLFPEFAFFREGGRTLEYQILILSFALLAFLSFGGAAAVWVRRANAVYFTELGRFIKINIEKFLN